jgi:predicted AlkP superfamily phosphohydrolase/phosphomutase
VWDILSRSGKQVNVVGVPGTYPPRSVNGCLVGCFLTPSIASNYTHPPEFKQQIAEWVGEYQVDVKDFRTEDKAYLLRQIYEMTTTRCQLVKKMIVEKPWDFFMFVEMGVDRIHHGLWSHTDERHWRYQPGNPFVDSIRDYYIYLDREIGEMLDLLPPDTVVMVVSDHGAKCMDGGIAINEWLRREGYLVLAQDDPTSMVPLERVKIDWSKTKAWSSGGYYARIFMNVQGREPTGVIAPADYERERDDLARRLIAIPGPSGQDISTKVFKPEEIYHAVNNVSPDLIVYFGDLAWRSVGSLGLESIYTFENDTGPDDANHAQQGMYILYDPAHDLGGRRLPAQIMDVAPTVLHYMHEPIPADMQGKVIEA